MTEKLVIVCMWFCIVLSIVGNDQLYIVADTLFKVFEGTFRSYSALLFHSYWPNCM